MTGAAPAQLCPKCSGTGVMSRPPGIPVDQPTWVSHTIGPYVCNVCDGRKVIGGPVDADAEGKRAALAYLDGLIRGSTNPVLLRAARAVRAELLADAPIGAA